MQCNCSSLSLLALRLPLILHALPPIADPRHDPRQQVEIPAADEDTNPKSQFRSIDGHAKDAEFCLENHGNNRKQIAGGIDTHEDEAYASHGTMCIDVPIVAKHTRSKQDRCEDSHECHRPRDMPFNCRLQRKYKSNFNPSHQSARAYQNNCTLFETPMLPVIVALAPCQ